MLKKSLLLLLSILVGGWTGCSAILQRAYLKPEIAATEWKAINRDGGDLEFSFKYEDVSLVISDVLLTTGRTMAHGAYTISIGPIFLPIIPRVWIRRDTPYPLHFRLRIESPNNTTIIDLSEFQVRLPSGRSLQLKFADVYAAGQKKAITPWKIIVDKDTVSCYLEFEALPVEIEELHVEFGGIQMNHKEVKLPPLKYHKVIKYQYVPVSILFHDLGE